MTIFMVTHDLKEGFTLATRVLAFDKVRIDPQAPGAYGATRDLQPCRWKRNSPHSGRRHGARCNSRELEVNGAL